MRKLTPIFLLIGAACGGAAAGSQPAGSEAPGAASPAAGAPGAVEASAGDSAALIAEARAFVKEMDADLRRLYVDASVAQWANETDITPEHEEAAARAGAEQAKGITRWIKAKRKFDPILSQLDDETRRQLVLLSFAGQPAPDDPAKADELARVGTEMSSIYGKGKVCTLVQGKEQCKDIEALSKVLQKSRKPAEALAAWQG